MSKKGENIYKRKDGRWEGRYKKGRKNNGQLKYGYLYGTTYKEVKERLYKYNLKYQSIFQIYGESAINYEEWVLIWLSRQQQQVKYSTYSTYIYKLKRYICPIIGDQPLNECTNNKIQELIDTLIEQELSPSTIHVLYQIVKKTFSDAVKQKYLNQSPCMDIYLPKKTKARVHALTKEEQVKLENEAKKAPLYKGLPILLALNAGLRIGEIAALKWKDIDFNNRVIHVQQTCQRITLGRGKKKTQLLIDESKTEQSVRTIPIGHSLNKYLKKWSSKSSSEFVCSNKKNASEPRLLTNYFHKIREKVGLTLTRFHHLRHTFATRCIEANGDIVSVSRLLGHASSKTTLDIYADSLFASQKRVITQMELAK